MVSTIVETHTLLSTNYVADVRPGLQFVFGHMARLAAPVLTHYRSDMYHDALWLNEYAASARFEFFWSVGESGTRIGTEEMMPYEHAYRMVIEVAGGKVTLTVSPTR